MNLFNKELVSVSVRSLILRLILGIIFFAHGAQKLLGWFNGKGLEKTLEGFQNNLGIPSVLGYMAIFSEFFGGIFLFLGFLIKPSSLLIAITMSVAVFHAKAGKGFFNPDGFEFPLTLLIIAIVVFLSPTDKYSIDNQLQKFFYNIKDKS